MGIKIDQIKSNATPKSGDVLSIDEDRENASFIGTSFAPSAFIVALDRKPNGSRVASTSYFSQITDMSSSFSVPLRGTYRIDFSPDVIMSTINNGIAEFQLVFDSGSANQIDVGDSDGTQAWDIQAFETSERKYRTIVSQIELDQGSHDLKVEWKVKGAGGNPAITTSSNMRLILTPLVASGIGGTITTQPSKVAGPIAYTDAGDVELITDTVECIEGEDLLVNFLGRVREPTDGQSAFTTVKLKLDGTQKAIARMQPFGGSSDNMNASFSWVIPGVTAGTRTVSVDVLGGASVSGEVRDAYLSITQFRGGLLPIKNNGVIVTDKPTEIDFSGSLDVTEVSGAVTVAISSSTIFDQDSITSTGWRDSGSAGSTYHYVQDDHGNDLEVIFNAKKGDNVLCLAEGYILGVSGHEGQWAQYQVTLSSSTDGLRVSSTRRFEWSTSETYQPLGVSIVFNILSTESHSLKLRYYKSDNHEIEFKGLTKIQKLQFS